MIIPIIPGSQSQLHDINDFRDQGIFIIISLSPVDQRSWIINFPWKHKNTFINKIFEYIDSNFKVFIFLII